MTAEGREDGETWRGKRVELGIRWPGSWPFVLFFTLQYPNTVCDPTFLCLHSDMSVPINTLNPYSTYFADTLVGYKGTDKPTGVGPSYQ